MTNRELLNAFVGAYPAQPATAFWRAIEIGVLARRGACRRAWASTSAAATAS